MKACMVTAGDRTGNKLVACRAGLTVMHQAGLVSSACIPLLLSWSGIPGGHGICTWQLNTHAGINKA